jgi:hypothetical protein
MIEPSRGCDLGPGDNAASPASVNPAETNMKKRFEAGISAQILLYSSRRFGLSGSPARMGVGADPGLGEARGDRGSMHLEGR